MTSRQTTHILPLVVRAVENDEQWEQARSIRHQVFVIEQACDPEEEWDVHDDRSRHLIGYADDVPVAVSRWRTVAYRKKAVAKLERFAVLAEYRGLSYGRSMVRATIDDARRAGFDDFLIHAQEHLVRFYADFGFEPVGDVFIEANIRHRVMHRLSPTSKS